MINKSIGNRCIRIIYIATYPSTSIIFESVLYFKFVCITIVSPDLAGNSRIRVFICVRDRLPGNTSGEIVGLGNSVEFTLRKISGIDCSLIHVC